MLDDLETIINKCRKDYDDLIYKSDIRLSKSIAEKLREGFSSVESKSKFVAHPFSIELITDKGLRADIPSSWLWHGKTFWPLANALDAYKIILEKIKQKLTEDFTTAEIKVYLKSLPHKNWKTIGSTPQIGIKFFEYIEHFLPDSQDRTHFTKFVSDRDWWFKSLVDSDSPSGKTLERTDVYDSSLALATRVVIANSSRITRIIRIFNNSEELRREFDLLTITDEKSFYSPNKSNQKEDPKIASKKVGENIIYYGAPGTGKSHTIDEEIDEAHTIRTVFHADTQSSDFTGCLKPIMDGDTIKYEFRPGPFTNAVVNAIRDPDHHYWLVIEEINRAPAAAAFGEIFQLLDRESDTGKSRYSITLSDMDMRVYIENEIKKELENGSLQLPGNLTLLATMNSSDQAVMPLDTAFKRRWKFKYIPMDFNTSYNGIGKPCAEGDLIIIDQNCDKIEVSWKSFATTINKILTINEIPEDRHLGPFFLSESEMKDNDQKETLTGKLFMYLWDDVLRHGLKDKVFNAEIKTYGQLTRSYDENMKTFSDSFYDLLQYEIPVHKTVLSAVADKTEVPE